MKINVLLCVSIFQAFIKYSCCEDSSSIQYGVMAAETSTDKENFCIIYYKDFSSLPLTKSEAKFHILQNDSYEDWCEDHPESDIKNKVLLLLSGNCSIIIQAQNVHDRGGQGILFITPSGRVAEIKVNSTEAKDINMTVGLISENSVERIKKMHGNSSISVRLFAPHNLNFDFSLIIIWVIAVVTVAVGSYWSGLIRFAIYCKEMNSLPGVKKDFPNKPSIQVNTGEESSMNINAYAVAGFVFCMGLVLLLLYFFIGYLIYFIIGLFVLASILSIHSCLEPLVLKIQLGFCRVQFHCGARSCNVDFRQVFLFAFSIAISLYWLFIRKQKYSWILQDLIGMAFCIHMLKSIRLPSFKICTILLVLLFFYDVFFVFITPYITGKAESVMEEVATGGNTQETVPMLFRVPHLGFNAISVCYQQYSVLGFGDLLVPGLLVSYCYGFDLVTNKKKIYFSATTATYGIGMIVTFVALFFMSTAQPALLYLVPCTIIPPAIIAYCRGEFSTLWVGFRNCKQSTSVPVDPEVVTEENIPSEESNKSAALPSNSLSANLSNLTHNDSHERNYLLR